MSNEPTEPPTYMSPTPRMCKETEVHTPHTWAETLTGGIDGPITVIWWCEGVEPVLVDDTQERNFAPTTPEEIDQIIGAIGSEDTAFTNPDGETRTVLMFDFVSITDVTYRVYIPTELTVGILERIAQHLGTVWTHHRMIDVVTSTPNVDSVIERILDQGDEGDDR